MKCAGGGLLPHGLPSWATQQTNSLLWFISSLYLTKLNPPSG
jgi:hypothetical protein